MAFARCWHPAIAWMLAIHSILFFVPAFVTGLLNLQSFLMHYPLMHYPKWAGAIAVLVAVWMFKDCLFAPAFQDRFLVWGNVI
jgi:hypothetical protein